jgi:hypothetical protein
MRRGVEERALSTSDVEQEAREISRRFGFDYDDARLAVERGLRYFRDTGVAEGVAADKASELMACAIEAAPRYDFCLMAMVEHILLSRLHRVPSCKGFTW